MSKFKEKYIGTRDFYMRVLAIAVPMIIQNLITNFVSMLDNIMVGKIGTAQMSGVSIANQYIFIFNITMFGAVSGAGIFGAQFFGKGDSEGQKYTFRFRIILAILLTIAAAVIFGLFGSPLINLFLNDNDSPEVIASTLEHGTKYLRIMILGLLPFAVGQAYSSVVRECGETHIPMIGSMVAIGINLILDYGLIFGRLGMPQLGVEGAAIATVIAKYIEASVVIVWVHTHHSRNKYIVGAYKSMYIPGWLVKDIVIKGLPLLFNEFLWSLGMSIIAQSFSIRGIEVVAARNIASTLVNLFNVVFTQLGAAIGILVGAELGAGKLKEARSTAEKTMVFALFITCILAVVLIPVSFWFPKIYNTEKSVQDLATFYLLVQALALPMWSYTNSCYFILRSGGKTGITFMFDFIFTWFVSIPLAFFLARYTDMDIHLLMIIVTYSEIIKVVVGYFMVRSDIWINNIVDKQ